MALLNDLLDLSKIEAGKFALDLASTDVRSMTLDVLAEFEATARKRSIVLQSHFEESLPAADIDVARIQQVIRNLVSNAVKFSPEGGRVTVHLSARGVASVGSGPTLEIMVLDEGPGVPPDELELVFEKFEQSSRTRSGAGGTGLGLAIVREIVHAHGGHVFVRNRQPAGAAFHVVLPYCREPETGAAAGDERAAA